MTAAVGRKAPDARLPIRAAASTETPEPAIGAGAAVSKRRGWFWLSDFKFHGRRVYICDTDIELVLDRRLICDALIWLGYHMIVRARSICLALVRRRRPTIWFEPDQPRPWYLIWSALAWSGYGIASSPETADLRFAFSDATWMTALARPAINSSCIDISKGHVAKVFEETFGYELAVEPSTWRGAAVMKSEANGVHDGSIVICPTAAVAGKHYQRLIDTSQGDYRYDLRTVCVGGRPVAVWIKRKRADESFSIQNLKVTLHRPADVFSGEELSQIARFLTAMSADWAGLDILRDGASGRIYVVDVNKTDVGPPVALSLRDKIRSTELLAVALASMLPSGSTNDPGGADLQPRSSVRGSRRSCDTAAQVRSF